MIVNMTQPVVHFSELSPGDVFTKHEVPYMKLAKGATGNCVELSTGEVHTRCEKVTYHPTATLALQP